MGPGGGIIPCASGAGILAVLPCFSHKEESALVYGAPTGGYTTPTLTIVALAIRLAEHITTELSH